jgi:hypothetical protein
MTVSFVSFCDHRGEIPGPLQCWVGLHNFIGRIRLNDLATRTKVLCSSFNPN